MLHLDPHRRAHALAELVVKSSSLMHARQVTSTKHPTATATPPYHSSTGKRLAVAGIEVVPLVASAAPIVVRCPVVSLVVGILGLLVCIGEGNPEVSRATVATSLQSKNPREKRAQRETGESLTVEPSSLLVITSLSVQGSSLLLLSEKTKCQAGFGNVLESNGASLSVKWA